MSSTQRPRAFRIPDPVAPAAAADSLVPMPGAPSGVRIIEDPVEIVEAGDAPPVAGCDIPAGALGAPCFCRLPAVWSRSASGSRSSG